MNPWTLVWIWAIGAVIVYAGAPVLLGFVRTRVGGGGMDSGDAFAILMTALLWWFILPVSAVFVGGSIALEWMFDVGAEIARRTEKKENV